MSTMRMLPLFSVLALSVACGGTGSGLEPDMQLGDFRNDDAEQLCDWVQTRIDKVFTPKKQQELSCTAEGVVAASSVNRPELCEATFKLCMDESSYDNFVDPLRCHRVRADDIDRDCSATVEEFEACIKAIEEELGNVINDINCDYLGSSRGRLGDIIDRIEDLLDDDDDGHPLEACRTVARNCEDFVFWD